MDIPIYAVYPNTFDKLPCITYKELNNKSLLSNLNDQFFPNKKDDPNDIISTFTPEEWNKKLSEGLTSVPNSNLNEIISKYTVNEWNHMMAVYRETGEKLWENTTINLLNENEETVNEETVDNTVPSTPIEFDNYKEFNPIIYAQLEYQVDFWGHNLTELVGLIRRLDEYIIHAPGRIIKTFTSEDLYETNTKIYHKIVRFKAIVDNHGNIFNDI